MNTEQVTCNLEEDIPENILTLRKISSSLPIPPPLTFLPHMGNVMSIDTLYGSSLVFPLHKSDKLAIVLAVEAENTVVDRHIHDQYEWIGVTEGKLIIEYDDGSIEEYGPNEVCFIPPKVPHTVSFPVYTELWAITQPAEPTWPRPLSDDSDRT